MSIIQDSINRIPYQVNCVEKNHQKNHAEQQRGFYLNVIKEGGSFRFAHLIKVAISLKELIEFSYPGQFDKLNHSAGSRQVSILAKPDSQLLADLKEIVSQAQVTSLSR